MLSPISYIWFRLESQHCRVNTVQTERGHFWTFALITKLSHHLDFCLCQRSQRPHYLHRPQSALGDLLPQPECGYTYFQIFFSISMSRSVFYAGDISTPDAAIPSHTFRFSSMYVCCYNSLIFPKQLFVAVVTSFLHRDLTFILSIKTFNFSVTHITESQVYCITLR